MGGFAGGVVEFEEDAVDLVVVEGDGHAVGHAGFEALDDDVFVAAEDGVVGAAEADVGDVGGAVGEDFFVGGLDVGVGAEDGGDFAVEHEAEGDFFGGCFGVEVYEDAGGFFFDFGDEVVDGVEGVVDGDVHEGASHGVDDAEFDAVAGDDDVAGAWAVFGKVEGADEAGFFGEEGLDFALVPCVVAEGDDVDFVAEDFVGDFWGDAAAAGGVFAVDDDEVGGVGFDEFGDGDF